MRCVVGGGDDYDGVLFVMVVSDVHIVICVPRHHQSNGARYAVDRNL